MLLSAVSATAANVACERACGGTAHSDLRIKPVLLAAFVVWRGGAGPLGRLPSRGKSRRGNSVAPQWWAKPTESGATVVVV